MSNNAPECSIMIAGTPIPRKSLACQLRLPQSKSVLVVKSQHAQLVVNTGGRTYTNPLSG
jgi:hypothetical protein